MDLYGTIESAMSPTSPWTYASKLAAIGLSRQLWQLGSLLGGKKNIYSLTSPRPTAA